MGLDYAAIPPTLRLMGVPRGEWQGLFEGLRIMERAAINEINERQK